MTNKITSVIKSDSRDIIFNNNNTNTNSSDILLNLLENKKDEYNLQKQAETNLRKQAETNLRKQAEYNLQKQAEYNLQKQAEYNLQKQAEKLTATISTRNKVVPLAPFEHVDSLFQHSKLRELQKREAKPFHLWLGMSKKQENLKKTPPLQPFEDYNSLKKQKISSQIVPIICRLAARR